MSDEPAGTPAPGTGSGADWRRAEPDSPCVRVCVVHPGAGICLGCLRTPDEIRDWARLDPEARRALRAELPSRAGRLRDPAVRPSRRRRARD